MSRRNLLTFVVWVIEAVVIGVWLWYRHLFNKLVPPDANPTLNLPSNNALALSPATVHHRMVISLIIAVIWSAILLFLHGFQWVKRRR